VLEICPLENSLRKKYLLRLGIWLVSRCDRFEERAGLDEALRVLEECLEDEDEDEDEDDRFRGLDDSRRADAFRSVARCRRLQYLDDGSERYFDASVKANVEALEIYRDLGNDKEVAVTERAVSIIYEYRYEKKGNSTEDWIRLLAGLGKRLGPVRGLEVGRSMLGICHVFMGGDIRTPWRIKTTKFLGMRLTFGKSSLSRTIQRGRKRPAILKLERHISTLPRSLNHQAMVAKPRSGRWLPWAFRTLEIALLERRTSLWTVRGSIQSGYQMMPMQIR
jgi:hypothetical protein